MVALATGLKYPDRCTSIITINTSIAGQRTFRMTAEGLWAIVSGLVGNKSKLHRNLADVLTTHRLSSAQKAKVAEELEKIAATDGLYVLTTLKQLILASRFSVKHHLVGLTMPVLLIYGSDDRFVPHINTRKLKSLIPHAQLLSIPDAGHEIMLDQPEALQAAISDWIDDHHAHTFRTMSAQHAQSRQR